MADDSSEIVKEAAESVAFENVKVGGGGPSFWMNLAMGNAVSNQQAMNGIQQGVIIKGIESLLSKDASEGVVDTALGQILAKLSQSTPPVTP
jgi:hypothetical protein